MKWTKLLSSLAVVLVASVGSAQAEQETIIEMTGRWTDTVTRGLRMFEVKGKTERHSVSLRVICDPDRVFGDSSNASIFVDLPRDKKPSRLAIMSEEGEQAVLALVHGTAWQNDANPAQWQKMADILFSNTHFTLVTKSDAVTFDLANVPTGGCV